MTEYKCKVCAKEYRLKHNYDRHVILCSFLSKSRSEQNDELDMAEEDVPKIHELYRIIQSLSLRMDKLEKENQILQNYHKKKMNIVDWLNAMTEKPETNFEIWMKTVVFVNVSNSLNVVYDDTLIMGLKHLFRCIIDNSQGIMLPIRCFNKKVNTFYVYENNSWKQILNSEFDKDLNKVCNQFIIDFKNNWYLVHCEKMETDERYKDMYINYYKKILGGDDKMSDDARFQKLRHYLYDIMKEDIKSVVEYDLA